MFGQTVLHYILIQGIHYAAGGVAPIPGNLQFPAPEIASFIAMWGPICLSSTMAFARSPAFYLPARRTCTLAALLCMLWWSRSGSCLHYLALVPLTQQRVRRYAATFDDEADYWLVSCLSLLVILVVQVSWLVWHA